MESACRTRVYTVCAHLMVSCNKTQSLFSVTAPQSCCWLTTTCVRPLGCMPSSFLFACSPVYLVF